MLFCFSWLPSILPCFLFLLSSFSFLTSFIMQYFTHIYLPKWNECPLTHLSAQEMILPIPLKATASHPLPVTTNLDFVVITPFSFQLSHLIICASLQMPILCHFACGWILSKWSHTADTHFGAVLCVWESLMLVCVAVFHFHCFKGFWLMNITHFVHLSSDRWPLGYLSFVLFWTKLCILLLHTGESFSSGITGI